MSIDESAQEGRGRVVQSVDRAISIMELLARDGWSGVTEIARELDVHKSTAFRLVSTLEERGMVEQHPGTQKYRLGFAIARLANGVRGEVDVAKVARPTCEQLSLQVDETVNLAVLQDGEVVSVEQISLSSSLISVDWIGQRHPLHATASGKVFLAFGPAELRESYLQRQLEGPTPQSITDAGQLRSAFAAARLHGYTTTVGELELGLNAVAAPVRDPEGRVVAAIVTSGPEYRMTKERLDDVGAMVRNAANTVSRRLGWLG